MPYCFPSSVLRHVALALVLLAAASASVSAQTNDEPTIGAGLKSGVQWPTDSDGDRKVGSTIGVFIDYNQSRHFGVIGDVLFVMTPERNEPGVPNGRLDYFQIPIMARARGGNGTIGAFGEIGPAFNLKISGNDSFQSQTVDLVFGGGVEIKSAMIEARLARGNREFTFGNTTTEVTSKVFQVLVGFRLR